MGTVSKLPTRSSSPYLHSMPAAQFIASMPLLKSDYRWLWGACWALCLP